jgi:ATP-binding cassette subfamily B protein
METRAAFSRAWGFLNFKPAAKWLALIAGVLSSLLHVAMLLLFGLFMHLLVHHGMPAAQTGRIGRLQEAVGSWLPWLGPPGNTEHAHLLSLLRLGGLAVAVALAWGTLDFLMRYLAAAAATEAGTRMRRAVYHHAFRLGNLTVRPTGPAEAAGLCARQVEAIQDALIAWLIVTVRVPVLVLLLLLVAFVTHLPLAVIIVIGAVLAWLLGTQLAALFHSSATRTTNQAATHLALLQESLLLLRLVKSYIMELFNQARLERQLAGYARAGQRRAATDALRQSGTHLLLALAGIALLFIAGLIVLDDQLSLTGLVFLGAVLASLVAPLRAWRESRALLARGESAAVVLFGFLDRASDVSQVVGAEVLPAVARGIEFDNVTLREPGTSRPLLRELTLTIPAGARVALVGPNVREHLALVCLVQRFLDPTSGEIRIDEHNLRWVTLESLRKQMGVVLQHNLVFNDTVAANIAGGDKAIKLPQITEAAKLAHAHQFIQKLPKGYDTPIGDMGQALNVGEQFRIALARAVLRNPPVLIVEEPAAFYLDEDTNDLLEDTYARVLPGRTVIFLPHREATLRLANPIFLLHQGRIEAEGDHLTLMKEIALYRHLFYLEFNEFAGKF